MAWRSSGVSNTQLIENMAANKLLSSERVKQAMLAVDRADYCTQSPYQDSPQHIGWSATISAPHMHAHAAESLLPFLHADARVLDIGSGSGYLTHVLANLLGDEGRVVGIDHVQALSDLARENMLRSKAGRALLETRKVRFVTGDGRKGWAEDAPYDAIHVGAAVVEMHQEIVAQLKAPGRCFIPIGTGEQYIYVVDKDEHGKVTKKKMFGVRYVPLTDYTNHHEL